jgi:hypothetical protein
MNETLAAKAQLEEATSRFLAAFAHATDRQWQFRPSPSQWSMADVTEHVAISTRNIGQMLSKRLLESPIGSQATAVDDVEIPYLFYRGDEPPNVARPTGSLSDRGAAADALDASARSIVQWADGVTANLRTVGLAHPVFGLLDGIQWLLFAAAHVERHRAQLIGLKRHRDFPG